MIFQVLGCAVSCMLNVIKLENNKKKKKKKKKKSNRIVKKKKKRRFDVSFDDFDLVIHWDYFERIKMVSDYICISLFHQYRKF